MRILLSIDIYHYRTGGELHLPGVAIDDIASFGLDKGGTCEVNIHNRSVLDRSKECLVGSKQLSQCLGQGSSVGLTGSISRSGTNLSQCSEGLLDGSLIAITVARCISTLIALLLGSVDGFGQIGNRLVGCDNGIGCVLIATHQLVLQTGLLASLLVGRILLNTLIQCPFVQFVGSSHASVLTVF